MLYLFQYENKQTFVEPFFILQSPLLIPSTGMHCIKNLDSQSCCSMIRCVEFQGF